MKPSSGASSADLFESLSALARYAALGQRLRAASEALEHDGWSGAQILLFGRRAATMTVQSGDLPFAFEPELASRARKRLFLTLEPFRTGGLFVVPADSLHLLGEFGRPPPRMNGALVIVPLTSSDHEQGIIVLSDSPPQSLDADRLSGLRLWSDIFATMIESDLRIALYEELELIMRSLRSEHEIEGVLTIVVDALAHEFGGTCSAWMLEHDGWRSLAISPIGLAVERPALERLRFVRDEATDLGHAHGIPLFVNDVPWGAVTISGPLFEGQRRSFVQTVLLHGELALANAIAFGRHRQFAQENAALSDAGRTLLGYTRLEPLATAMSRLGTELCDGVRAAVYLMRENRSEYECVGSYPTKDASLSYISTADFEAAAQKGLTLVAAEGRILIMPLTEKQLAAGGAERDAFLVLERDGDAPLFSREVLRLLEAYAALCALALRNVRLYEESAIANRALAESNAFKDDLLAMFAHDFKGPLTVISGYGELVLDRLDNEERESVAIILAQVKRLARLTDDALTLARAQSAGFALNREAGELITFVQEAVRSSFGTQEERIVIETRESGIPLHFDPIAVLHVLDNVVGNALKYSTDIVHIELIAQRGEAAIVVRDRGIGIPADELANVFGRFARASNARRRGIHGSGVGLYIAKRLTEQHGGRIFASSCEGEGSTFEIRLPQRVEKL